MWGRGARLIKIILLSLAWGAFACASSTDEPEKNLDFLVQASTVEAMEGGPLAVKVTLQYQGKQAIRVYSYFQFSNSSVEVRDGWVFTPKARGVMGIIGGAIELRPGDQLSETQFLHHQYSGIPSCRVTLKVTWPVRSPDGKSVIAHPSTTLKVDIPPADTMHLAALRKRIEEGMGQNGLTGKEQRDLANLILHTKHRALIPVALQMIEARGSKYPTWSLIDFAYECTDSPDDLNARFVQLATDPRWESSLDLFESWRTRKIVLPERHLKQLMAADRIWTRAMTYTTFRNQCEKSWISGLLTELAEQQKPIPQARFANLLRDLDDDDFFVREKATDELRQLGERVHSQLKRCLEEPLSLEPNRRVTSLVNTLEKDGPPGPWVGCLAYFGNLDTPESGAVLEALARGAPDAWLTKEAKAVLESRAKRSRPSP